MTSVSWGPAFEAYSRGLMDSYGVPGVAVGVARDGHLVYERGFGDRDRERGLPVTPDTVFGIGSVTKSFTCVAIMQLQEAGRLSVHDPVVKYLPEFRTSDPGATRRMTIHHFMTHTSGLPPLPSLFGAMVRSMEGDPAAAERMKKMGPVAPIDTPEQLMDFIARGDFPLLGPPGAQFSYSNDAYALLGTIIERVSGVSYPDFIAERILRPAGMESTTFDPNALAGLPDVATLYAARDQDGKEEIYAAPRWWQAPAMLAAGFLRSNVRDMLRYLEIFRTGGMIGGRRVLSAASVKAMTTGHARCAPGMDYGYGLMLTPEYHGASLVEHGGSLKGVAAYVSVVPERGLTGVALANLAGVPSAEILLGALNGEMGLPVDTRRVDYEDFDCPAARLPTYAGVYRSGEGEELKVTAEDGRLVFELEGKRWTSRPVGEHTFAVRVRKIDSPARFLLDGEGQPHAVAYHFRIIRRIRQEELDRARSG